MSRNKLPWNFRVDTLMPIAYYRYTSSVEDRVVDLDTWNRRDDQTLAEDVAPFEALKAKCLATPLDCSDEQDGSNMRLNQWDNKVVICFQTNQGNKVYIGQYNGNWTMGLGVRSDSWIKPQKYQHRNLVRKGDFMIDMDHWKCKCKGRFIHPNSDSVCTKCATKREDYVFPENKDPFLHKADNPNAWEVKEENMFTDKDIFLGTYSREALLALTKQAYLTNFEDKVEALKCFEHQEIWLKDSDFDQNEWFLELAEKLINIGKITNNHAVALKESDILAWITDSLED